MKTYKDLSNEELGNCLLALAAAYKIALKGDESESFYLLAEAAKRLWVHQAVEMAKESIH